MPSAWHQGLALAMPPRPPIFRETNYAAKPRTETQWRPQSPAPAIAKPEIQRCCIPKPLHLSRRDPKERRPSKKLNRAHLLRFCRSFQGNRSHIPLARDDTFPGRSARMRRPTVRESDAWKLLLLACRGRLLVLHEGVCLMTAHTRPAFHEWIGLQLCHLIGVTCVARAERRRAREVL